ncbi:MAG: hypothetical protein CXX81_28800 [Methanobacteriota archaeon]|nr:MAG: hypothetical protein CXX81_28800 [Euryarchaeota archaeon]HIA25362.1 hypothetical protein [Candidatus Poseidoniales archaeon]HIB41990.1 hypothetical protein [Candidatus Poseidoniales archaeon]HIO24712.1 hypothetical protein [Candidatus Poseidoniales archaeon]
MLSTCNQHQQLAGDVKSMKNMNKSTIIAILGLLLLVGSSITQVSARPTGISNVQFGCTCHSSSATEGVVVTLDGVPDNYLSGESFTFTITITGGPSQGPENYGGFNLVASAGTLSPFDNTSQLMDGEMTHTEFGNDQRTWQVNWTAPEDNTADITFTAHGNAVNGDGSASSDDQWNKVVVTLAGAAPPAADSDPNDDQTPGFTLMATLAIIALAGFAGRKEKEE